MTPVSHSLRYHPGRAVRSGTGIWPVIAVLLMLVFAALSGMAIAVAGKMAAMASVAAVMGLVSLMLPVRHLVALLLITAFLVMGQMIYFAGVSKAFWMPLLLGLVLLIRLPAELMRRNRERAWQAPFQPKQSGAVRAAIIVFFAALAATTLINQNPLLQIFVSGKEYLFLWGLYLVIATGLIHPALLAKVWAALPWLLPLQIPIILYQRFVVAARRSAERTSSAWDAVVGAFGGDPGGGGQSGAMGLFVVIAIVYCIVRWRKGLLKTGHCALIILSGLAAIVLAEVKFAVVMVPVAIAAAYLRDFLRRPVAAAGWLIAAGGLSVALLSAYEMQYWNEYQQRKIGNYTENVFSSSFSADFINMQTGEMGRVAALTFWASQQDSAVDVLIGHGMGASRKGDTVVGEAARPWPFVIARSTLAILLWEAGVLGTLAFMSIFVAGFIRAYRLTGQSALPEAERAILMTCMAVLAILFLELPYNTDALYSPQIQIMLMLCLGQIAMSGGRVRQAAVPSRPSPASHALGARVQ